MTARTLQQRVDALVQRIEEALASDPAADLAPLMEQLAALSTCQEAIAALTKRELSAKVRRFNLFFWPTAVAVSCATVAVLLFVPKSAPTFEIDLRTTYVDLALSQGISSGVIGLEAPGPIRVATNGTIRAKTLGLDCHGAQRVDLDVARLQLRHATLGTGARLSLAIHPIMSSLAITTGEVDLLSKRGGHLVLAVTPTTASASAASPGCKPSPAQSLDEASLEVVALPGASMSIDVPSAGLSLSAGTLPIKHVGFERRVANPGSQAVPDSHIASGTLTLLDSGRTLDLRSGYRMLIVDPSFNWLRLERTFDGLRVRGVGSAADLRVAPPGTDADSVRPSLFDALLHWGLPKAVWTLVSGVLAAIGAAYAVLLKGMVAYEDK